MKLEAKTFSKKYMIHLFVVYLNSDTHFVLSENDSFNGYTLNKKNKI